MKKIILLLVFVLAFGYESIPATVANIKKLQKKHILIVDIRTPDEWMMTGVIPGAVRDTFFEYYGAVNPNFYKKLKQKGIGKTFAIICRTGHRSRLAAQILEKKGYKIIELQGGMFELMHDMLHIVFRKNDVCK
ncbi:rhodanese-like domain-containing protein [Caminibacter pacificus]